MFVCICERTLWGIKKKVYESKEIKHVVKPTVYSGCSRVTHRLKISIGKRKLLLFFF
jgi:hypothetical protein